MQNYHHDLYSSQYAPLGQPSSSSSSRGDEQLGNEYHYYSHSTAPISPENPRYTYPSSIFDTENLQGHHNPLPLDATYGNSNYQNGHVGVSTDQDSVYYTLPAANSWYHYDLPTSSISQMPSYPHPASTYSHDTNNLGRFHSPASSTGSYPSSLPPLPGSMGTPLPPPQYPVYCQPTPTISLDGRIPHSRSSQTSSIPDDRSLVHPPPAPIYRRHYDPASIGKPTKVWVSRAGAMLSPTNTRWLQKKFRMGVPKAPEHYFEHFMFSPLDASLDLVVPMSMANHYVRDTILYSVRGTPGPRIVDICHQVVRIDGEDESDCFEGYGGKQISFQMTLPGFIFDSNYVKVNSEGKWHKRGQVLYEVASLIQLHIEKLQKRAGSLDEYYTPPAGPDAIWDFRRIDIRRLHIFALYRLCRAKSPWVAVIGMSR
ncbi:hypothetical protein CVT25_004896 [Psilocybe cyanescens]|uniref:Uncharacterized protein n=1 Tax=Psilocybe cyanescens TaxID=93625 RepID=A0A409XBN2_PSICY|nr:hypothetical protein CVT25_004896 [Psilocybe cyanescens]